MWKERIQLGILLITGGALGMIFGWYLADGAKRLFAYLMGG